MPYQMNAKRTKKHQSVIDKHQNQFPMGYVSTFANSRRPEDSVSDATNMELVQDNIWRPRAPLVRYGTQPTGTVNGRGKYRYNGVRGMLWMIAGRIYRQVD